jgi:hypothetical protein
MYGQEGRRLKKRMRWVADKSETYVYPYVIRVTQWTLLGTSACCGHWSSSEEDKRLVFVSGESHNYPFNAERLIKTSSSEPFKN